MANEDKASWLLARRQQDFSQELSRKGWFHSFRLPDGTFYDGYLSVEELQRRISLMPFAGDLRGKRVLDIGAWDGWYSFETERRGAEVVAVDCVEVKNFRKIHEALQSRVTYHVADIHEVTAADIGRFDIVLFLSVLYHLKHPLLALEKVCALTKDLMVMSSFTSSDYRRPMAEILQDIPRMDFYETDELGGQLDNWVGPNLPCLMALCRAAGFARVAFIESCGASATLACFRHWLPPTDFSTAPPRLLSATNARTTGINFRSTGGEEYIACWFESHLGDIAREDVKPEAGGYAVPCVHIVKKEGRAWQCSFRLPPGLDAGWHDVTLRIAEGGASNPQRIAVDIPVSVDRLEIHAMCDAFSWTPGVIEARDGARGASIWVHGLPANADRANVKVFLSGTSLNVDAIAPADGGATQVNAMLPEAMDAGKYPLTVAAGGHIAEPIMVELR